jgi:hypothetical protein
VLVWLRCHGTVASESVKQNNKLRAVEISVAVPEPHHFWKLDPNPYQSEKQDPDPHQSEKVEEGYFEALEGPNLEKSGRIRIRMKLKGRIHIRIRIKVKSRIRIRIRIKLIRISTTGQNATQCYTYSEKGVVYI